MKNELIRNIVMPAKKVKTNSKRAVIYTRVSTKEQADNNASLETQLKYCREFCQKLDFVIIKEFGGTYESAQSDDGRVEFNRMLDFTRLKKNDIQIIVVYSYDRFSRSGGFGISIITDLFMNYEIQVRSVTQTSDVSTPEGLLQTNILMLFSRYDNDVRRQKVTSGMKEKLLQGYFVFNPPIGYSTSSVRGIPVPNEDAKFIKMAFELKERGCSHDVICDKLKALGFDINIKRLTAIFKNPFYSGYITSSIIEGDVVKGKHEPIISEETFLRVNDAKIKYNKDDYKKPDNDPFPLKGFILCSKCNKNWTAYQVKKKKKNYYKCNTTGCKCNRNAGQIHTDFTELLKGYKIPVALEAPLKAQLKMIFDDMNKTKAREKDQLQLKLKTLEENIMTVKTKLATDKITDDVYNAAISKLSSEEYDIKKVISEANFQLSNHKEFVEFSVNLARNIDRAWTLGDTSVKRKLQRVLFPKGIEYNNEEQTYRTLKVNGIFGIFNSISTGYKIKEEGQLCYPSSKSVLVVPARIELASKV